MFCKVILLLGKLAVVISTPPPLLLVPPLLLPPPLLAPLLGHWPTDWATQEGTVK